MKKILFLIILMTDCVSLSAQQQKWEPEGWLLFLKVKFEPKFLKEHNAKYLIPVFNNAIKAREGTLVSLSGYYLPFKLEDNRLFLSKYPYAACFFCGGAGPESVVEVIFPAAKPKLKQDQVITVKGKLKLNDTDIDRLNFILEDAVVIEN